jgi:sodium/bile acid cotransporter 7
MGVQSQQQQPGPSPSSPALRSRKARAWRQRLQQFVVDNYMVLSFSLAMLIALVWPLPGAAVGALQVGDVKIIQLLNNIMVFLVTGLTLKSDELTALIWQWPAALYGIAAILLITPCMGFAMVKLPLYPAEFAAGLAIFCAVPTSLGQGITLTAASRGNQALALFFTVSTNLLGIVSVPYTLRLVLANSGGNVSVEPQSLVVKLIVTVLVPTVAGKLLQQFVPGVRAWVSKHKTALSMFGVSNIAMIMWTTLSSVQGTLIRIPFAHVAVVIALGAGLHLVFLAFNAVVTKWVFQFPRREGIAVLIMGSQKSAPVAITVISYMTPDVAQQGLLVLPCIIGQLSQIFIGSLLAKFLRSLKRPEEEAE